MAKALVGLEGRGEATVFGGTTNPISVYMQTRAARQRQAQQEAQNRAKNVQDSLDYLDKMGDVSTKFSDLNTYLANGARQISDMTRQQLRENPDNISLAMAEAKNLHRDLLASAREFDGLPGRISLL